MVRLDIDSELLIKLVEERPVIWNKNLESYKSRPVTKAAWKEIVEVLLPGFCEKKRLRYGKLIIQKWTHIRDSFMRSLKKMEEQKKMGCSFKAKRYIYAKQLSFFQETLGPLDIYDPLLDDDMESKDDADCDDDCDTTASENNSEIDLQGIVRNMHVVTKVKRPAEDTSTHEKMPKPSIDENITKFLDSMESLEKNRHMSFFKGLLPSLNGFDDDETIEFQMGVLQLLKNIKNDRDRPMMNADFNDDCAVPGSSIGNVVLSLSPMRAQHIKQEI